LVVLFFFFFQAEDGIRDKLVTGVQTCALPILGRLMQRLINQITQLRHPYRTGEIIIVLMLYAGGIEQSSSIIADQASQRLVSIRSEERRVGKECRYRWWRYQ